MTTDPTRPSSVSGPIERTVHVGTMACSSCSSVGVVEFMLHDDLSEPEVGEVLTIEGPCGHDVRVVVDVWHGDGDPFEDEDWYW